MALTVAEQNSLNSLFLQLLQDLGYRSETLSVGFGDLLSQIGSASGGVFTSDQPADTTSFLFDSENLPNSASLSPLVPNFVPLFDFQAADESVMKGGFLNAGTSAKDFFYLQLTGNFGGAIIHPTNVSLVAGTLTGDPSTKASISVSAQGIALSLPSPTPEVLPQQGLSIFPPINGFFDVLTVAPSEDLVVDLGGPPLRWRKVSAGFYVAAVGGILASGATLVPTASIHHVSGTSQITSITPPDANFRGTIRLIPDGAFTTATGGNIGKASTAVVGRVLEMTYDGTAWWPSY